MLKLKVGRKHHYIVRKILWNKVCTHNLNRNLILNYLKETWKNVNNDSQNMKKLFSLLVLILRLFNEHNQFQGNTYV